MWGKGAGEVPADSRGCPRVDCGPRAGQRKAKGVHGVEASATEGKEREVDRNGDRRWGSGGGSEEVTGGGEGDSNAQRCSEQVYAAAGGGKERRGGSERVDGVHERE